jgi:hypothetical protein
MSLGYLPEALYNDTADAQQSLQRLLASFAAEFQRPEEVRCSAAL